MSRLYTSNGLTGGSKSIRRRALASYLGFAAGDALGATTEFMLPREISAAYGFHNEIRGGGWLKLKAGKVTDDTEMCLALGEAIIETRDLDLTTVADKFVAWMRSKPVDMGSTVRQGLQRVVTKGQLIAPYSSYSAGNGAAMRNLPVVLATLAHEDRFRDWTLAQSRITHHNKESDRGALFLGELARQAILQGQLAPLEATARQWIDDTPLFDYRNYKGEADGYIVNTVKTVLFYFFNTGDFESCLTGIVNRGGDADTNGALAGMIAGAFYGMDSIPQRWLKKLDKEVIRKVEEQVKELLEINH